MRKLCTLTLAMFLATVMAVYAQDAPAVESAEESTEVVAEESTEGLTISGSVDSYARGAIGADRDWAPNTAFANKNGFALGMVNLVVAKEGKKAGFVADLVYGPRGADAVFNSTGSSNIVNQLYAYYKVSDAFKLTLGNFNTYLGYEVISPVGNFNYTTSYMFSWGPFSHTGLRADYAISDKFSAMVAVMNPTDWTDFNPTGAYTLGAQLGYSSDAGSAFLNFTYGDQDGNDKMSALQMLEALDEDPDAKFSNSKEQFQVDLTTGWNIGDAFFLGLNTTINSVSGSSSFAPIDSSSVRETKFKKANGFYGVALYPQYSFSDNFALGLRGEYFSEFERGFGILAGPNGDGYDIDGAANVLALTLSGNIKAGNLTIIPEIRMDNYSEKIVPNDGKASNTGVSALLAAVYAF